MATATPGAIGPLLRRWREDAGMKLDRAAVYASDLLGSDISSELVRRYETDKPERQMQPVIVAALLTVYGRRESDLPEPMRSRVGKTRGLLDALSRCTAA